LDGRLVAGEAEVDFIPKPAFKRPPVIPKEENRTGVNKKTYFVCNEPGQTWSRLPQATPAQIAAARKMKKFFTGYLDAPVVNIYQTALVLIIFLRSFTSRLRQWNSTDTKNGSLKQIGEF
jgi:hypothetical protein